MKPKFDIGAVLAILTLVAAAAPSFVLPRSPSAEVTLAARAPNQTVAALPVLPGLPARVQALQTPLTPVQALQAQ
jgi:hypothetical protein